MYDTRLSLTRPNHLPFFASLIILVFQKDIMGQLTRIEVNNFKSYKSKQKIDFGQSYFTSIIGPNGAGKSNMMDAISFVLGIKSSHLRSTQLKDLVYRGRIMTTDNQSATQGDDDPRTASVTAVYVKDDGDEVYLKRSINLQGSSEYRLNGKTVSAVEYSRALEKENILIKARNFLVFQGDVEAIAAQSPKDLTRLIEQISGSLDYKNEYEELKSAQEKAAEASNSAFGKKRHFNSEIRRYQDQKHELELFELKQHQKDLAISTHLLWQLYHYTKAIESAAGQIDNAQLEQSNRRQQLAEAEEELAQALTRLAKCSKADHRLERNIRKIEKSIDDKTTSKVPVDEKIKVINDNEKRHESRQKEVSADFERQTSAARQLQVDLGKIDRAIAEFENEQRTASQRMGIRLSDEDLHVYAELKEQFNFQASKPKSRLDNLQRQQKTIAATKDTIFSQLEDIEREKIQFTAAIANLNVKLEQTSSRVNSDMQALSTKKSELNALVTERQELSAKQDDLNEKLQECLTQLVDVHADKRESEHEMRLKETISSLKRLIPGVRGRVCDLCKPKQHKYETAMSTVLGRNFEAIVVDSQKTATDCIAYMREQRAGICTFIPLDTVVVKPISSSLKGIHKQARMAIDTIDYDASNERAMQYACGNAIICDDMDVAKYIRWDRNIEAKVVTLEGSIIHKGGLMTGGRSSNSSGKKWEDQTVKGLQLLKDNLMAQLAELAKSKRSPSAEEALTGEISGLEQQLSFEREDLDMIKRKLRNMKAELQNAEEKCSELRPRLSELEADLARIDLEVNRCFEQVQEIEDQIFASFCKRIGVQDIRQYEEFQGKLHQEASRKRLLLTSQKNRVANQLNFEQERVSSTEARLNKIRGSIEKERQIRNQLLAERIAIEDEIRILQQELEASQLAYNEAKQSTSRIKTEVSQQRAEVNSISKLLENESKQILALQEELDKETSLKINALRNCKLQGIEIPLLKGSLNDLPIVGTGIADESIDADDAAASQMPPQTTDYGIVVDFDSLSDELKEDGRETVGEKLLKEVHDLTAELEKMTPNTKAVERLDEIEGKLQDTEDEFDLARRQTKSAKDRFNSVKERRLQLFNKAYTHISEQIDKIYKELTKSRSFPLGGTAYLTIEDQDEPYLDGIKYHAMPPMKRFRDMEQLSGGEKTMAALALLFSIHSYRPSPFFVLDEVDAALDNANVAKIANYIHDHAGPGFQFIVISLKNALFQRSDSLVGIYRAQIENSSRALTLDLKGYPEVR
ncbi:RecF/RecN/SMC protein [Lipomyces oligophaga]|uniref:RecF/RecN/SMC protein n=1 Tax=Lipomyces oligophaga TaxID=45792 RepID=UPI0034CD65A8